MQAWASALQQGSGGGCEPRSGSLLAFGDHTKSRVCCDPARQQYRRMSNGLRPSPSQDRDWSEHSTNGGFMLHRILSLTAVGLVALAIGVTPAMAGEDDSVPAPPPPVTTTPVPAPPPAPAPTPTPAP